MRTSLLSFAVAIGLATGVSGCAHKQLTNRQVAKGAVVAGTVLLIVAALVTQCNDHNNCDFQPRD